MITDLEVLADVQATWRTVLSTRDFIARNLAGTGTIGGIPPSHEFRNLAYGLCLLFACSVLQDTLSALRCQGAFACGRGELGALLKASRNSLPWTNYDLVFEAKERRNAIAHAQAVIERGDTWRYIDAIEAELRAWRIVH